MPGRFSRGDQRRLLQTARQAISDALAGRLVSLPIQPEVVGEAAGEIAGRVIDAVSASRGVA